MPEKVTGPNEADAGILTGTNTHPTDVIPQGTVKPGTGPLGANGPNGWEDMILHTGEARGLADTAYHSLEPDAPTVGAARERQEYEEGRHRSTTWSTSNSAPD